MTLPNASRRSFMRLAGIASAMPILTEGHFARAAMFGFQGPPHKTTTLGSVLINANENPLGPSKAACEAIAAIAHKGGRYDIDNETGKLAATFAAQNHLPEDHIAVYAGSSEPLHFSVLAFTSPEHGFVSADPSYEAGTVAAKVTGAKISMVALTPTHAHDLRAMLAADPTAGLIYICNPNNPTGTLTPREDILFALENKPKGSILLVDEAYIHLSDAPSMIDQVAAGKDLIVLRTFSKVYGMAGIRCGLALGRPDLLAKLEPYGMNAMPITGSAAANVSLLETGLVPERKKIIADIRNDTFAFLKANHYSYIPSHSNCFMIDTGRSGKQVIAAMRDRDVYIGRTWPVWPNHVRVSVGSAAEMARFKVAFKEVMDAPAAAAAQLYDPFEKVAFPRLS